MWLIFFLNISAGIMFIGLQSPMIQNLFRDYETNMSTEALATYGASLIAISSIFNGVGRLVTLLQAAVSRQVETAKDVATSVQSSVFNLSIMIASSAAGMLLGFYSPMSLVYLAIALSIPGIVISFFAKKSLS